MADFPLRPGSVRAKAYCASADSKRYNAGRRPGPHMLPILDAILRACLDHRIHLTNFGLAATGDPGLVNQLKCGRELRWATVEKVRSFIASLERDR